MLKSFIAFVRSRVAPGFSKRLVHRQTTTTRNAQGTTWITMEKLPEQGVGEDNGEKIIKPAEVKKNEHTHPVSKRKRNKKRKKGKTLSEDANEKEEQVKNLPNYFLGVQITSPLIKGGMKALQDSIVKHDKRLRQAVVNVKTAHLTLGLLYLPSEESIIQACDVLRGCQDKVKDILDGTPIVLNVSSIGTFGGKVIFAKISPGEDAQKLEKIAEMAGSEFEAFKSSNTFDYKPHITLMKLSKAPKIRKKVRRIESTYYENIIDVDIGVQKAETLQLLSMLKKKRPDGYYHCECEIPLYPTIDSEQSSPDSSTSAADTYSTFISAYSVMSAFCDLASPAPESSAVDGEETPQHGPDPTADTEVVRSEMADGSDKAIKEGEKHAGSGKVEDPSLARSSVECAASSSGKGDRKTQDSNS